MPFTDHPVYKSGFRTDFIRLFYPNNPPHHTGKPVLWGGPAHQISTGTPLFRAKRTITTLSHATYFNTQAGLNSCFYFAPLGVRPSHCPVPARQRPEALRLDRTMLVRLRPRGLSRNPSALNKSLHVSNLRDSAGVFHNAGARILPIISLALRLQQKKQPRSQFFILARLVRPLPIPPRALFMPAVPLGVFSLFPCNGPPAF